MAEMSTEKSGGATTYLMKSIGCRFNGESTGISHKIPLIWRQILAEWVMDRGNGGFLANQAEISNELSWNWAGAELELSWNWAGWAEISNVVWTTIQQTIKTISYRHRTRI